MFGSSNANSATKQSFIRIRSASDPQEERNIINPEGSSSRGILKNLSPGTYLKVIVPLEHQIDVAFTKTTPRDAVTWSDQYVTVPECRMGAQFASKKNKRVSSDGETGTCRLVSSGQI